MADEKYENLVKDLQTYLNSVSHAGLTVDGSLGGKTAYAAKLYEQSVAPKPKKKAAASSAPRVAHCLFKLRDQINHMWPNRDKTADGWIGDAAHAQRKSDHNAKKVGDEWIVFGLDVTHDPAHGVDGFKITEHLIQDPRIKYVIFHGRIYNPSVAKVWRPYDGQNAHNHHFHVSVTDASDGEVKDWTIQ
jgi:hypothetical protein